jgi:hypothetical protein
VQIKGLILFMSAMVHPNAFLCSFRVCNNLPNVITWLRNSHAKTPIPEKAK